MYYRNDPSEYSLSLRSDGPVYKPPVEPNDCGFIMIFTDAALAQAFKTLFISLSLSCWCWVCMRV